MSIAGSGVKGRDWLAPLLVAACIVAITPKFMELVIEWGHQIPSPDVASDYVEGLTWALVLGISILWWPIRSADKAAFICLWWIKLMVVLGALLVFESHYPMDAYNYFRASQSQQVFFHDKGGNETLVWLAKLHHLFLFDSFHTLNVSFAMIGLVSVYVIYRAACVYTGCDDIRILWLLALFPSILFWSSFLGKDPVNLLGFAVYSYGVVAWYTRRQTSFIVLVLMGVAIGGAIRLWTAAIMLAPFALLMVLTSRGLVRVGIVGIGAATLVVLYDQLLSMFKAASTSAMLETLENRETAYGRIGGSATGHSLQFSGPLDLIRQAPVAAFNALFRPLPGEVHNVSGLLSGAEDLLLLLLALRALLRLTRRDAADPIVLWAFALVCVWASVYGLFSFGNLGALARYRLQILPVFVLLLLYLGRPARLRQPHPIRADNSIL